MVNGHSNWYWGWGLEDHDMSHRLTKNTLEVFQTDKYKKNDQIKDFIQGTSAKWGSQNFVRQDKYGFYKMLKHGYGMTSGKQRKILEVGVGPKVSLLQGEIALK